MRNDRLNVGPSKSHPVNQPEVPLPLSLEMSAIKNEFWSSSFEQTGAGDATILYTLQNHQRSLNGQDGNTIDDGMWNMQQDYEPASTIGDMHSAPRFGHSNRIGSLASRDRDVQFDYANGIKQFTLYVTLPFFFWTIILLLFKVAYGTDKVGCAAGGGAINIVQLSKQGVHRRERRRRILRSWRLQSTFCIVSVLIPVATVVLVRCGLKQLELAWGEIQDINDDVESIAYRGMGIVVNLRQTQKQLRQMDFGIAVDKNNETNYSWCPNLDDTSNTSNYWRLEQFDQILTSVQSHTEEMVSFLDLHMPADDSAFNMATDTTHYVDKLIDWAYAHDWLLKLFLMALNVVNVLLLAACNFMSKNDIIHPPSRYYLAFFLVPLFSVLTGATVFMTATFGVGTLLNSDFCAGGPAPGSPSGAIEDAILLHQFGTMDRNQGSGVIYESFKYYAGGCLTDFPLAHFGEFQSRLAKATAELALLSGHIKSNDNATIEALSQECGADVSFLPTVLQELSEHVDTVAGNVKAAVDLTGCHMISPLVRRLTHGALCHESTFGLTWVWACLLAISIFAFTLLSTRAALYNSVKTKKKSKKKLKAEGDTEFEDYKEFMAEYFPDANEWTKEPVGKKVVTLEIDIGSEIRKDPTFETQTTTPLSTDSHDDLDSSDRASRKRAFIDEDEDSDDDSSYASSSSDESEENDGDSQSALSSFFAETASLARRTIQQIRNLPPLLGGNNTRAQESFEDSDILVPESPYRAESQAALSPTMSDWPTPRNNGVPLYASSRVMEVLTPLAPQKIFNFLARTSHNEEMEPLTPSRPSPSEGEIAPRKLALSPLVSPGSPAPKSPAIARRVSTEGFKSQVGSCKKESSVEPSAPVEPRRASVKGYRSQVGSYKKVSSAEPSAPVEPRRASAKGYRSQVGSYKEESSVEPSALFDPRRASAEGYRNQVGSYKKEFLVEPSAPVEPRRVSAKGDRSQVRRLVQNFEKGASSEPSPVKSRAAAKRYRSHVRTHEEKEPPSEPSPLKPRAPIKGYTGQAKSSDQDADKSFLTAMIQQTVRRFTPERPKKVYKQYGRTAGSNDL